MMKRLLTILVGVFVVQAAVAEERVVSHNETVSQQVSQLSARDRELNRQREIRFNSDLSKQQQLLATSQSRLKRAEAEQLRLKQLFDDNDSRLADMQTLIQQQSGQLGEVFGVAKEEATNLRLLMDDSLTRAENPSQSAPLAFADARRVPALQDLQALWQLLQNEMLSAGDIQRFESPVVAQNGVTSTLPVIRFGLFAAATEQGEYLHWDNEQQVLSVLPTQPAGARSQLQRYLEGSGSEVTVDPSRGQLFLLLDSAPKLLERIHQGGGVGYLIIALGVLGLVVALYQMQNMVRNELLVRQQLKQPETLSDNNALGRVLTAVTAQPLDQNQRELKVDEAILQELPKIEGGQSFIKLLAAVAPLLGLLGTVVGMIATFQSITLFGTGDPKLMAGGISQALMTTVLGLVVSIPLLFSHSYLNARGRRLVQILQEKSLGLLAGVPEVKAHEALNRVA